MCWLVVLNGLPVTVSFCSAQKFCLKLTKFCRCQATAVNWFWVHSWPTGSCLKLCWASALLPPKMLQFLQQQTAIQRITPAPRQMQDPKYTGTSCSLTPLCSSMIRFVSPTTCFTLLSLCTNIHPDDHHQIAAQIISVRQLDAWRCKTYQKGCCEVLRSMLSTCVRHKCSWGFVSLFMHLVCKHTWSMCAACP